MWCRFLLHLYNFPMMCLLVQQCISDGVKVGGSERRERTRERERTRVWWKSSEGFINQRQTQRGFTPGDRRSTQGQYNYPTPGGGEGRPPGGQHGADGGHQGGRQGGRLSKVEWKVMENAKANHEKKIFYYVYYIHIRYAHLPNIIHHITRQCCPGNRLPPSCTVPEIFGHLRTPDRNWTCHGRVRNPVSWSEKSMGLISWLEAGEPEGGKLRGQVWGHLVVGRQMQTCSRKRDVMSEARSWQTHKGALRNHLLKVQRRTSLQKGFVRFWCQQTKRALCALGMNIHLSEIYFILHSCFHLIILLHRGRVTSILQLPDLVSCSVRRVVSLSCSFSNFLTCQVVTSVCSFLCLLALCFVIISRTVFLPLDSHCSRRRRVQTAG